jgi:hypothetical protein
MDTATIWPSAIAPNNFQCLLVRLLARKEKVAKGGMPEGLTGYVDPLVHGESLCRLSRHEVSTERCDRMRLWRTYIVIVASSL